MDLPPPIARLRRIVPRPEQQAVREALRRYGVLTASHRPLPDYLVIGTKKGGTTSIINWLVRHPHVMRMYPSIQKLKSSHYFDINYAHGEQWYRSHFPSLAARERRARTCAGRVIVGEASPYYMFHPAVPYRVRETLPSVRVLALLRDPVSRAYSNYWDRMATCHEDLPTFEAAIDAEGARLAGVDHDRLRNDPSYYSFHHDHHTYLARGRYLEHLEPWLQLFPRDQLLILSAEELFTDTAPVLTRIQRFLGLPPGVVQVPLMRYNERQRVAMEPATRVRLAAYYRPHNAALYARLGEDFGWERGYPT